MTLCTLPLTSMGMGDYINTDLVVRRRRHKPSGKHATYCRRETWSQPFRAARWADLWDDLWAARPCAQREAVYCGTKPETFTNSA